MEFLPMMSSGLSCAIQPTQHRVGVNNRAVKVNHAKALRRGLGKLLKNDEFFVGLGQFGSPLLHLGLKRVVGFL